MDEYSLLASVVGHPTRFERENALLLTEF